MPACIRKGIQSEKRTHHLFCETEKKKKPKRKRVRKIGLWEYIGITTNILVTGNFGKVSLLYLFTCV